MPDTAAQQTQRADVLSEQRLLAVTSEALNRLYRVGKREVYGAKPVSSLLLYSGKEPTSRSREKNIWESPSP